MAKPKAFMDKHGISDDEIWQVRPGAFAIKHHAIERIAAIAGVKFERPAILEHDGAAGIVSMVVFGKLGEHEEWSTGEASPKNNKNAYPFAMAEKRGKGRVILKLLAASENIPATLYSEEDSEDFKKRDNPHVTQPEDIFDGELDGDIPPTVATASPRQNKYDPSILKVKDARPAYAELMKEMQRYQDPVELREWAEARADDIHALPGKWPESFRIEYTKHKQSITNGKAA